MVDMSEEGHAYVSSRKEIQVFPEQRVLVRT